MGKIIIDLIGLIVIVSGIIAIYDAREIAINHFNEGETNEAVKLLKTVGFIVVFIGMGVIYITTI